MKKIFISVILLLTTATAFSQEVDTAWVRRYNGPANNWDIALAIAVDSLCNVYVTGTSVGSGTSGDYTTIKYYPNGDTAWVRRYNGPPGYGGDQACVLVIDYLGNVYVTGQSQGNGTNSDYATIKYYPNGDSAWVRRYHGFGNGDDYACDVAVDRTGNVYVTGWSLSGGPWPSWDYATVKYDRNGNELWVRRYDGPTNYADEARAIALDDSGNIYVTGNSGNLDRYMDYATIKYYPNGDTAWVRRYNGPSNGVNRAVAIAIDDSANIYVSGSSLDNITGFDYATIKYYPNGDTAWVRRYNGPGNGHDEVSAIAIDSSGNVYVTGSSDSGPYPDYVTIKYYPNGDTAWVRRYNGSSNYGDYAKAIVLDASGNVYVTGQSLSNQYEEGFDCATIKYDPDGNELWVRRYNGPSDDTDEAWAIATDDSGNVYITGRSDDSMLSSDYATIKYWQDYTPNSFSLLSPSDSSMILYVVTFNWGTATDPDPWDTAKYDLYVSSSSIFHPDSTIIYDSLLTSQYTDTLDIGRYYWKVRAYDKHSEIWSNQTWSFLSVMRGDANADKKVSVSDVIFIINYLFKDGPPPSPFLLEQGDVNCNGHITVTDVVYLINYLFKGGEPPCS